MRTYCCDCNHRHSIFCIVPPHMLRALARYGNDDERGFALDTLALDNTHRMQRAVMTQAAVAAVFAATPVAPTKHRLIYNTNHTMGLPGTLARAEGQGPVADNSVNQAYDGLGNVFDFYLSKYHRNSINNAGMTMTATVHYSVRYNNAFWNGNEMIFGDGDGMIFKTNSFTADIDVIGHELTHGVTQFEAGLAYHDQPGALNESVSDVFGSMIKQFVLNQTSAQADWLIGAGILTFQNQALRSMKAPGTAYNNPKLGQDPQPANMANYVFTAADNGGVHINSGIPNHAFYLLAIALGGHSWEKAGQIWYDTLQDPALKAIQGTATFKQFANLTVSHAGALYGANSNEKNASVDAWQQVGVLP
jgi:Zn-dependent metalloprotease